MVVGWKSTSWCLDCARGSLRVRSDSYSSSCYCLKILNAIYERTPVSRNCRVSITTPFKEKWRTVDSIINTNITTPWIPSKSPGDDHHHRFKVMSTTTRFPLGDELTLWRVTQTHSRRANPFNPGLEVTHQDHGRKYGCWWREEKSDVRCDRRTRSAQHRYPSFD